MSFEADLRELINRHSKEGESDTPDYILAQYIIACLAAFTEATKARDAWGEMTDVFDDDIRADGCSHGTPISQDCYACDGPLEPEDVAG